MPIEEDVIGKADFYKIKSKKEKNMKKKILALASVLALVTVLAVPTAALGDTTDITGNSPETVEVTAPDGFAMPSLVPTTTVNTEAYSGANTTATVHANCDNWTLTASGSDSGKMKSTTTATTLAAAMKIKGGDVGAYATLASAQNLETGADSAADSTGAGTVITDIYFQQALAWTDAADDYSITITFTAAPGA